MQAKSRETVKTGVRGRSLAALWRAEQKDGLELGRAVGRLLKHFMRGTVQK